MSGTEKQHGNAVAYLFMAFAFTIPWEPMVTLPPFGGISRIVGYAAFGIGGIIILMTGHWRRPTALFGLQVVFVAYMLISLSWMESYDVLTSGLIRLMTYFRLLIMSFMVFFLGDSKQVRNGFLGALLLGDVLLIVLTMFSLVSSGQMMSTRIFAPGTNPNGMAGQLALGIPFAVYLAQQVRGGLARWMLWFYVPIALLFVALTASRGGLIASAVALLYILLLIKSQSLGRRIVVLIALATVIVIGYRAIPEANVERLSSINSELSKEGSIGARRGIWLAAWQAFETKPWLGYGVGQFSVVAPRLGSKSGSSHNTFLAVMVEVGVVGGTIFLLIMWGLFRASRKMRSAERDLWLIVLLTWVTISMSGDTLYAKDTWFIFGLLPAFVPDPESEIAES